MKLIILYCLLCRFFFELSGVVGAYFFLPMKWALIISAVFILWQILSFSVVKASKIETTPKDTDA